MAYYMKRKRNLKLYNALFPGLKDYNIVNSVKLYLHQLKTKYKSFQEFESPKILIQYFIFEQVSLMGLFSVYLNY